MSRDEQVLALADIIMPALLTPDTLVEAGVMTEQVLRIATGIIDAGWLPPDFLPTDEEGEQWYDLNIDQGCSASSGIYKFRLWLKDRATEGGIK